MSASTNEDSDYIEFSTAEAIISSGGDPRLQGLRKRLQAKKELLKQFDRMYSSFLGGSAAASELRYVGICWDIQGCR